MATFYETHDDYVKRNLKATEASFSWGASLGVLSVLTGAASLSGAYSKVHQERKENFQRERSSLLVTQSVHHDYRLVIDVSSSLTQGFRRRVDSIADSYAKNLTLQAAYKVRNLVKL